MEIRESDMLFSFHEGIKAVKYDDEAFYRKYYNVEEGTKGVDIIADSSTALYFIEVKNCEGTAENQDRWRRRYSGTKNINTLASEIASKVAHTCICLAGVSTFGERNKDALRLWDYAKALHTDKISTLEKQFFVLLYLEGDFSCQSRTNAAIYQDLRQRIEKRLRWLNCKVDVVSTKTRAQKDFDVMQQR